jgi:quinol monooxygenase YgiN
MANNTYFLKITGSITWEKHREFQQTVLFVFNHLPTGCIVHDLTQDVFNLNVFHLFTMWASEEALATFKNSHEYHLLKGSFKTLGSYTSTTTGRLASVQMFDAIEINM